MFRRIILILAILPLLCFCQSKDKTKLTERSSDMPEITVTSSAFEQGGEIPQKYTCDGENVSPPLKWNNVPKSAKSLALICDDPDAPVGTWVHWVLFNIPPEVTELPEDVPPEKTLSNGAKHGKNSFKKFGYGGPCPPKGPHRYYVKIYALDTELDLKTGSTKKKLVKSMKNHIVAEGSLMGKYSRK